MCDIQTTSQITLMLIGWIECLFSSNYGACLLHWDHGVLCEFVFFAEIICVVGWRALNRNNNLPGIPMFLYKQILNLNTIGCCDPVFVATSNLNFSIALLLHEFLVKKKQ